MRVNKVAAFSSLVVRELPFIQQLSNRSVWQLTRHGFAVPPYGIKVQLPLAIVPLDSLRDAPPF